MQVNTRYQIMLVILQLNAFKNVLIRDEIPKALI